VDEKTNTQSGKFKGYILGFIFACSAGLLLGWAGPLLELVGIEGESLFTHPLFYVALLIQLVGGVLNFLALSYLRPAIVFPIYGSIQIFESVIVAQFLLPATNPWHNLYIASLVAIVIALILIAYSLSKKPQEEVVDLLPPSPTLQSPDAMINEAVAAVFKLLDINLMAPYGRIRHRWAMAGTKYTHPTLVESCYISLIWNLWLPQIAIEILEPFLDAQDAEGRLPNQLKMFSKSYIVQPPIIAHSLSALDVPLEGLQRIYPKLKAYQQWYNQNRRTPEGLFFWKVPAESGMSEAPRFRDVRDCSHILPVDLNVYIVLQNRALAMMARKLGIEAEAIQFDRDAAELAQKIQATFWDKKAKIYYDWDLNKKGFVEIAALPNFLPIVAGIPDENQFEALLTHLSNAETFNTRIPFPMISLADTNFNPRKESGAVYIALTYLILGGLRLYKREELVSDLTFKLIQGVISGQDTRTFYEYYSPDQSRFPLVTKPSADYIGSTGLVNTLLIEDILGLRLSGNEIHLHPRIPAVWRNQAIIYKIPTRELTLTMQLQDTNEISVELSIAKRTEKLTMKNYHEIKLNF